MNLDLVPWSTNRYTINELENNNLCMAGDDSVRDQLGAHSWCLAQKNKDLPSFKISGPVDGNRHTMRALRAESTHVLARISYICSLEKYVSNTNVVISVYTDCKTLSNRLNDAHVNNLVLVMTRPLYFRDSP